MGNLWACPLGQLPGLKHVVCFWARLSKRSCKRTNGHETAQEVDFIKFGRTILELHKHLQRLGELARSLKLSVQVGLRGGPSVLTAGSPLAMLARTPSEEPF